MQPKRNNLTGTIRLYIILYGVLLFLFARLSGSLELWWIILTIVQLVVLDQLLQESNIFQSPIIRLFYISGSILLVGALFILLHFPNGHIIASAAHVSVAALYTYRTLQKQPIKFLDITKWLWLTLTQASTIFTLWRLPYAQLLAYFGIGSFFLMMLAFFISDKSMAPAHVPHQDTPDEDTLLDQL